MKSELVIKGLRDLYDYLLMEKEVRSPIGVISKESGISRFTINRLIKGEIDNPLPYTVMKLKKLLDKYSIDVE